MDKRLAFERQLWDCWVILLLDALLFKGNSLLKTLRRRYMCLDCSALGAWSLIVSGMNFLRGGEGKKGENEVAVLGLSGELCFLPMARPWVFLSTFSPVINNLCGLVQFASKEDIKWKWLSPCSFMGNYGATGSVSHLPGLEEDWPGSPQSIWESKYSL